MEHLPGSSWKKRREKRENPEGADLDVTLRSLQAQTLAPGCQGPKKALGRSFVPQFPLLGMQKYLPSGECLKSKALEIGPHKSAVLAAVTSEGHSTPVKSALSILPQRMGCGLWGGQ
jgi:hypothetical protein